MGKLLTCYVPHSHHSYQDQAQRQQLPQPTKAVKLYAQQMDTLSSVWQTFHQQIFLE